MAEFKGSSHGETVLVLSAGAPHSPLVAGALSALCDAGGKFDTIYTAGAGALIGLLYAAPQKTKTPKEALASIKELGVSDPLYRLVPINYKTFFKPGPFTQPIHRLAQRFKLGNFPLGPISDPRTGFGRAYNEWVEAWLRLGNGAFRRFYNDLVDLCAAAITPTSLTWWSKGLCQPLPFLEDMVDFKKLNDPSAVTFFVNALSVTDALMDLGKGGRERVQSALTHFCNKDGGIQPEHVRAAFAHPYIYPPSKIGAKVYFEGADYDPIGFKGLRDFVRSRLKGDGIKRLVVIDILGSFDRYLLREPRDLWEAFGIMILAPVVSLAKKEMASLRQEFEKFPEKLLEFEFHVPPSDAPHMTDWSYSNMSKLFKIGEEDGKTFWRAHGEELWGVTAAPAGQRTLPPSGRRRRGS